MKLKITTTTPRLTELGIEKDKTYEVDSVVVDSYRIAVPMKRAGKFKYALIGEDEGKLVEV